MLLRPWLKSLLHDFTKATANAKTTIAGPRVIFTLARDVAVLWLGKAMYEAGNPPKGGSWRRQTEERFGEHCRSLRAPEFANMRQSIYQAGVVGGWAALEGLTEDLWAESLNRGGPVFKREAFRSASDSKGENAVPGLANRHINVGLLAKHGFDLRDRVGSLLSEKFSFKKVSSIENAYRSSFGPQFSPFEDPKTLFRIECMRHVIVHRGGTIDREYVQNLHESDDMIGCSLALEPSEAKGLVERIEREGTRLLYQVAVALQSTDPLSQPEEE